MGNLQSTVCVVMPVYNGAKTIMLAIKSLLYQTYPNWNCVIVNDGSKDSTKELLDTITDKRFRIIHLDKNRGRGFARQVAMENAKGDYISFLDADDFYHFDKLRIQIEILTKHNDISLVSSGAGVYDQEFNLRRIRRSKSQEVHYFKLGGEIIFLPATSMIRYNEACNFTYNIKLNASEDIDFLSKYLLGRKYFLLSEIMYYYSEYESINYKKVITYALNNLKRIVFTKDKLSNYIFYKSIITVSLKLIIYIFAYPMLGKKYFLNKRGLNTTQIDQAVFTNCLLELNQR